MQAAEPHRPDLARNRRRRGLLAVTLSLALATQALSGTPPPPPRDGPPPPAQRTPPPPACESGPPCDPYEWSHEPHNPPPLPLAMRVIYAPFYVTGLVLRYGVYYVLVAPFEVLGRTLAYGAEGGVDQDAAE